MSMITDGEIDQLRELLFRRRADAVQLRGLVACHDALGRSHRRQAARSYCSRLFKTSQRSKRAP
jgi:hypothetical protein